MVMPRSCRTVRSKGGAVHGIASLTRGAEMRERILELARAEMPDDEIAVTLTREGHRSPTCPDRVLPVTVQGVRLTAGLKVKAERRCHPRGLLGVMAMAERMGIPSMWLYAQIRSGRILIVSVRAACSAGGGATGR